MDQVVEERINDDVEETFFQDIDVLQNHGINAADIKKLKQVGICTIKGIQMCTRKRLCAVKGLSEAKVDKIKEITAKLSGDGGFLTALEFSDRRKQCFKISTGSQELDKLLGGGIESMAITEAFGEFRTGKTQLSHTLCVTAQLPNGRNYTGGKVIFIDTENTFRPDRLRDIADRFNLDQDAVLDNVLYARAYTSEHQFEILDFVAAKFHEELGVFKLLFPDSRIERVNVHSISSRPDRLRDIADRFNLDQDAVLDNVLYARAYTSEHQFEILDFVAAKFHEELGVFKLLIVDSIMALFRVDFSGRGELADRQQKLAQMLSRLQKISEEYNTAVFITNQMTADPGATMSFQADPKKPVGGHVLAHASTTRISLRKGRAECRIAKIYDSPELPENEATFAISGGGITDVKE